MATHSELRDFWERRLEGDWTESGVGYRALGRSFNTWMYRVREEVFLREVSRMDPGGASVLDVGSGTGFYTRLWERLGVGDITGCDMTDAAVERLRGRFPDHRFVRQDAADLDAFDVDSFDAVSCMDVLFHITDDGRYTSAFGEFARVLRPGGLLVISENCLQRPEQRGEHQVNRTLEWIAGTADKAGFDMVRRVPMLMLMNAQVDAPAAWRKVWGGALRAVTLTEPTGWLAGAALYPLERRLVRGRREGPTTELVAFRLRGQG
ncbi:MULTISPECIES: class I SAM-dependent methyltransferase [Nocardiopsis]|uniref:2-polyprenyl-3-methyl-5-hydroxy-6-metoxy-1, 4-benzoquinol methylase n=1 Tax=Nocardiopsis sinuspersici TaxID=501010 RepID=A0A1V3C4Q7_9ACTN|nr:MULTISPECIES: class I SAM-dependent methyltransferase [Nocardiopsis]OOC55622.1 2-polyprenyl-3-methyl-5-hydroxy-6-metoxy-1,4-benzoquinol methylase [Nocardiopsis sinuspersici]